MSRIEKKFAALKAENKKAFIPYIMGGDPDYETSLEILENLPEAGASVIELGMPFTDPMADGPTIQSSGLRALKAGITISKILQMAGTFREKNQETPLVLMGYFNPVLAYGVEKFVSDAAKASVDGLLIVDLPPEEDDELWSFAKDKKIDVIKLITPTTDDKRLTKILEHASGWLYYVAIAGITGTRSATAADVREKLSAVRKRTDLPLAVGFGINSQEDVKIMSSFCDAVVVGSALVKEIEQLGTKNADKEKVLQKVRDLASAL